MRTTKTRVYVEQVVASREYFRSRALGVSSVADDQSCWIAILPKHWPMPGYLHCDEEPPIHIECCYSVYI